MQKRTPWTGNAEIGEKNRGTLLGMRDGEDGGTRAILKKRQTHRLGKGEKTRNGLGWKWEKGSFLGY